MNINKIRKRSPFRSKIVVRLWLIMMVLVVLSVAFMWVVQIFLFQQNYVNATVSEVQSRLEPIMEELKIKDLANHEQLILSLSKAANGKMMVINGDGKLTALYSAGHKLDAQSMENMSGFINYLKQSQEYQQILLGKSYHKIVRYNSEPIALEIGIPVLYGNRQASVVLYHSLDQLHTVLQINRNQLVMLSIILTLVAAMVAALLSRRFVKPIRIIKSTVDKDYSQLQAGYIQLKKDWYSLYEIVESEIANCEQSAAEYGIMIRLESTRKDIPVHVDAMKICQVMRISAE